jgi:hypothetical protein
MVTGALLLAATGVPAMAATFTSPVVVGTSATEPGIKVATDGTIYITGPAGLLSHLPGSASLLWRSDDGGASFVPTPPSLRALLPGGGDSDVATDPATGKLYMSDLWLGSDTVATSNDKGQSWLANPLSGVVLEDRQWIAAGGNDVAYHVTHQIPLGLIVSKSIGGLIYPISSLAATPLDQTGCICPPGNLLAEGGSFLGLSDNVGVIYSTSMGGVKFARSTNGGLTFTNVEVKPASAGTATNTNFPVVANAGSGKLVAVWLVVQGNGSRVELASSGDWGASWSAPRSIVTVGTSVYPWVAAKGQRIAVSLYHTDAAGTPDTVPSGSQWFESYLESTDGGVTFSALQTVDPTPAKTGIVCTGGTNCTSGRELGDFQSVATDPQGRANVTWNHVSAGAPVEVRFARTTS